jgi:hypothetical protein
LNRGCPAENRLTINQLFFPHRPAASFVLPALLCANLTPGNPAAGFEESHVSRIYDELKRAQSERAAKKGSDGNVEFDRRREERVAMRVPVFVYGHGARNEPFHEETSSIVVNTHGALLSLSKKVKYGQQLLITNPATHLEQPCRVVFLKQQRRKRVVEVGVAFTQPAPTFWTSPGDKDRIPT